MEGLQQFQRLAEIEIWQMRKQLLILRNRQYSNQRIKFWSIKSVYQRLIQLRPIQQRDQLERYSEMLQKTLIKLGMQIENRQRLNPKLAAWHEKSLKIKLNKEQEPKGASMKIIENQTTHYKQFDNNKKQLKDWQQVNCQLYKKSELANVKVCEPRKSRLSIKEEKQTAWRDYKKQIRCHFDFVKKISEIWIDNQNISLELTISRIVNADLEQSMINISKENHKIQAKKQSKDNKKSII